MTLRSRAVRRATALTGSIIVAMATLGAAPGQAGEADGAAAKSPRLENPRQYGVPAFQDARNRQVKVRKINFARTCPSCAPNEAKSKPAPTATARIKATATSYKILDQNDKFDFYLVDVTSEIKKRKGDPDWGWYDMTVKSIGKTKVRGSSYSEGKDVQNVTKCKNFPVSLGVGYYGVSVGTTVGHVSFCNKGSKMLRQPVSRGNRYHATGVTGIRSLQAQRYVRVPQGKKPKFRVSMKANFDHWACGTFPDGYRCYLQRGFKTKSFKIGTKRQR